MFEYDEEKAVQFMENYLPLDLKDRFPEDTLYYLLDVICEFYENHDWLSEEDEEQEEKELIRFLIRQAEKDEIGRFSEDEIRLILAAETAYSDTLEIPE